MKRIVTSLGMIVFVAAIVVGGTGAFFSDTETSTGNVFTAGAIDLKVDSVAHINGLVCFSGEWVPESIVVWNASTTALEYVVGANVASATDAYNEANPSNVPQAGDACEGTWSLTDLEGEVAYRFFDYGDLKPGDNGENTISLHVLNNDAYMCATVANVATNENGFTDPEADVDTSSTTGELQDELEVVIWEDDGDNILETGEEILTQTDGADGIEGTYPLYTPGNGAILASTTAYLGVYWCYGDLTVASTTLSCNGAPVTNMSQTDSLSADISFYVEQARHNDDFTCRGEVVEGTTAILTLRKQVNQDGINPVADSAWTLSATSTSNSVVGTDNDPAPSAAITNQVVTAGTYTLTESAQIAGFTLTGISCTDGTLVGKVLTLVAGDNAVCTFTNVENATST